MLSSCYCSAREQYFQLRDVLPVTNLCSHVRTIIVLYCTVLPYGCACHCLNVRCTETAHRWVSRTRHIQSVTKLISNLDSNSVLNRLSKWALEAPPLTGAPPWRVSCATACCGACADSHSHILSWSSAPSTSSGALAPLRSRESWSWKKSVIFPLSFLFFLLKGCRQNLSEYRATRQ